ncbi:hypothetical protein J6590_023632 [Homalodisca vitripennis]|nr:hypothetical protein J6590_023632 [Homalodisca vitripennis]
MLSTDQKPVQMWGMQVVERAELSHHSRPGATELLSKTRNRYRCGESVVERAELSHHSRPGATDNKKKNHKHHKTPNHHTPPLQLLSTDQKPVQMWGMYVVERAELSHHSRPGALQLLSTDQKPVQMTELGSGECMWSSGQNSAITRGPGRLQLLSTDQKLVQMAPALATDHRAAPTHPPSHSATLGFDDCYRIKIGSTFSRQRSRLQRAARGTPHFLKCQGSIAEGMSSFIIVPMNLSKG